MRNITLEFLAVSERRAETTLAITAFVPALVALFAASPPIWVLACVVYVTVGIWQSNRWSNLLVSWWLGWMLTTFTCTFLLLIPPLEMVATTNLLAGLTIFTLVLFNIFAIWNRNYFHNVVMITPVALELARLALFRDLVNAQGVSRIMTLTAALVYGVMIILLFEWHTERYRWLITTWATAAYAIAALVLSWPIILGYVVFYNYLPFLLILFGTPVLGGLALRGVQKISQHSPLPHRLARLGLPLIAVLFCSWIIVSFYTLSAPPAAEAAVATAQPRQKVIIDTDMSFDDYVALLYLLQHPEIEVVGITSVHGVANLRAGTENIYRLLALTEQESIPVAMGATASLNTERHVPAVWATIMDHALRPALPQVEMPQLPAATSLMNDLITAAPEEVTVVALGPLTNLADLFNINPALAQKINHIVIGGGAIDVPNPTPDGEKDWNLWLDPAANEVVLNSGADLWVTPLDLTHYGLRFNNAFVRRWTAANRQSEPLLSLIPSVLLTLSGEPQPIWDMVTAAVVTNPDICTSWQSMSLSTVSGQGANDGFLQVNRVGQANAQVCLQGDQAAFETAVLNGTH